MRTIIRSGHLRKLPHSRQTIYISPTRVRNVGARGKGPKLIGPLHAGMLTKYGYHPFNSLKKRHTALKKAIREGVKLVQRRLRAIATLTKRTIPRASGIYLRNRKWVAKYK